MAYFLYFNSKDICKLVKKKIKDGTVDIEGKKFIVDISKPRLLQTPLGYKPLYIVKWNNTEPAENINPLKFDYISPKFKERFDMTPEMLKKLIGLKILGNMIKTRISLGPIFMLVIGIAVGSLILYSLIAFGLI
ncbi:MAG: hypothetical protein ACE5KE_00260 [Methanosarcinales archaeon]